MAQKNIFSKLFIKKKTRKTKYSTRRRLSIEIIQSCLHYLFINTYHRIKTILEFHPDVRFTAKE